MIKSFKHKGLAELFVQGRTRRIQQSLQSRCLRRLDALDQTESLKDLNVPGFNFHGLQGTPKRYTIHVNGSWCINRSSILTPLPLRILLLADSILCKNRGSFSSL